MLPDCLLSGPVPELRRPPAQIASVPTAVSRTCLCLQRRWAAAAGAAVQTSRQGYRMLFSDVHATQGHKVHQRGLQLHKPSQLPHIHGHSARVKLRCHEETGVILFCLELRWSEPKMSQSLEAHGLHTMFLLTATLFRLLADLVMIVFMAANGGH